MYQQDNAAALRYPLWDNSWLIAFLFLAAPYINPILWSITDTLSLFIQNIANTLHWITESQVSSFSIWRYAFLLSFWRIADAISHWSINVLSPKDHRHSHYILWLSCYRCLYKLEGNWLHTFTVNYLGGQLFKSKICLWAMLSQQLGERPKVYPVCLFSESIKVALEEWL